MKKSILTLALWLGLTALVWFGPRQEVSLAERRKLAQMPELTAQSVQSGRFMSEFERFTQDQFPMREAFRGLKARFAYDVLRQKDNHGVYLAEGQAVKLEYPLKENSVAWAMGKFQTIYEQYLQESSHIVFSVVPDKSCYLAETAGAPTLDYDALFALAKPAWARYADLTGTLSGADYYRTDAHWRQERLLPAAQVLCEALGVQPPRTEDFTQTLAKPDFRGVYSGQAALPLAAEPLYLLESPLLDACTVHNYETGRTGAVYDLEKLDGRDPYDVFLSGAAALLRIENAAGTPGKELIVFRDSFGSSLVPLLLADYAQITVVDIRYLPVAQLGDKINFHGKDVLFLFSTTVLNNGTILR